MNNRNNGNDGLVPRPTDAMRARRHPRAILGIWAWEGAFALLGSLPAAALARAAYGAAPGGDALLWRAGALPLLAFLTQEANGVRASVATALGVLAIGAVAGILPLAALLTSIANTTSDGRCVGGARAIAAALRAFRPLVIVFLTMSMAEGLVVAAAFGFGDLAEAWTHASLGEAGAQKLGIAVGGTMMPVALALGVMHDLSRAAAVRFELGAVDAMITGGRALRRAPFAATGAWAWRALAALAPVIAMSFFAGRVGARAGVMLAVLAALHQTVVLARIALRASWLAKALRLVDPMGATLPFRASVVD